MGKIYARSNRVSEKGAAIDRRASIVFPSAFAVFNLSYWTYYLTFSH